MTPKIFALILMLITADDYAVVATVPSHTDGLENVQTAEACDALAAAQEQRQLLVLSSGNGIFKDAHVLCVSKHAVRRLHLESAD